MTIYARSDLAAVTVPAEGFGGCGDLHSRPVANGAPVQIWALDCYLCEDHLRHDPHWAVTPSEIAETHDEKNNREDFERRGAKDKDAVLTLALARLAGIPAGELPDSLTRMISGQPMHVPGLLECPNGHGQPSGQKFCGQCGSPMSGPAPKAALGSAERTQEPPSRADPPVRGTRPRRLRDARLDELQALARDKSVSDDGTRPELIARLAAAGVTSADLGRLPVAA